LYRTAVLIYTNRMTRRNSIVTAFGALIFLVFFAADAETRKV
jgi:hypothetical protein